ncbi:tRNA (N(6)-L-threonylcarbamoyladenosine(37)-C(2))-methylthiotransferase [Candidatus Micrarchaeota archaeon]|nr:tRNA (N(6)-L-threonylcarbamoyladenosine(37)-C(2))-methylthiotransferase [Candidatus Micrarchaeota archaeon]
MARVFVETYGCTLNHADSDIIKAVLKHEIVENEELADVIILNTCTVKGTTENRICDRMKSLKKPFVVAGCLSANEKKIRDFAPGAPIVGTSSICLVNDAVKDALAGKASIYKKFQSKENLPKLLSAPIMRIPINDGCLSSCNFCQTKLARPFLRSFSPKTIVRWINESVKHGAREIQLTSMDSGAYGYDVRTNLVELLELIANDDSKDAQDGYLVRLGMINPDHAKKFLPDLKRILKHRKFYKFLHAPVQAGSEKVVKEMNRDHSVRDFADIVNTLRSEIPGITISTDIIVGYPTETEDDYEKTLELIRETKPEIINLSKFSPRPGTKARELPQLRTEEIKRRSKKATDLIAEINSETRKALIGNTYRVLITEKCPDYKGRNINYMQVVLKGFHGELGQFADVKINNANHNSLFGDAL